MKNITISVPDEVYRTARIKAAEEGTSVSAIVRDHLESMRPTMSAAERGQRLRERMERIRRERKAAGEPPFRLVQNLTREELYDEAFRGHEYPPL